MKNFKFLDIKPDIIVRVSNTSGKALTLRSVCKTLKQIMDDLQPSHVLRFTDRGIREVLLDLHQLSVFGNSVDRLTASQATWKFLVKFSEATIICRPDLRDPQRKLRCEPADTARFVTVILDAMKAGMRIGTVELCVEGPSSAATIEVLAAGILKLAASPESYEEAGRGVVTDLTRSRVKGGVRVVSLHFTGCEADLVSAAEATRSLMAVTQVRPSGFHEVI
jgi:hypothetical protein